MGAEMSFPYPEREELCLSLGTSSCKLVASSLGASYNRGVTSLSGLGKVEPSLGHLTSLSKTEIITPPLPWCWEDSLVNAGERALKVKGVLEMLS